MSPKLPTNGAVVTFDVGPDSLLIPSKVVTVVVPLTADLATLASEP
jgi:hypothetical protein